MVVTGQVAFCNPALPASSFAATHFMGRHHHRQQRLVSGSLLMKTEGGDDSERPPSNSFGGVSIKTVAPVMLAAAALFVASPFSNAPAKAQNYDLSHTPLARSGSSIEVMGDARVVDGDTIVIQDGKGGKERIRLAGIDAPESKQVCKDSKGGDYACGVESQQALQKLVGKDKVKCLAAKRDMYQRIVGVCYDVRTGVELNKAMIDEGEAIAYTAYSKAYTSDEEVAKKKGTGMWKGEFQKPWEYRKMKRSKSLDEKTVRAPKKETKSKAKTQEAADQSDVDDAPGDDL